MSYFRSALPAALFSLVFFAVLTVKPADAASPVLEFPERYYLNQAPDLSAKGEWALDITGFGASWRLQLQETDRPIRFLSASQQQSVRESKARFFTGQVGTAPSNWVRLSSIDGRWSGGFFDGQELYLLESASAALPQQSIKAGDESHIALFRAAELTTSITIDDGGVLAHQHKHAQKTIDDDALEQFIGSLFDKSGQITQDIPLTVVTDTEFNAAHGSNVEAVAASRVHFVDGVFTAQLGVGMALAHLEVLSNNGPLTQSNGGDLLVAFRQFVPAEPDIPFLGLAHLFTGKTGIGSAGLAYFGSLLCNSSWGYGWNQNLNSNTLSAMVVAHEIGHNLNGQHDNDNGCGDSESIGIMSATISSAIPQEFSSCSVAELLPSIAAGSSCLITREEFDVIFRDRFEES